jgi:parvulin-like peptidyl-prolyl isomerase
LTEAVKITQALREGKVSFCVLALQHSKGKQSQENGGFVGVRFLAELLPEIAQAVSEAVEGEVLDPVH